MADKSTLEVVQDVVERVLLVDAAEATPDARLVEDLNADSLDAVELVMALEERLGVQISDDDFGKLTTVGAIVKYLDKCERGK